MESGGRVRFAVAYCHHPDDCGRGSRERQGGDGGFGDVVGVSGRLFLIQPAHEFFESEHTPLPDTPIAHCIQIHPALLPATYQYRLICPRFPVDVTRQAVLDAVGW
jgi:hypothetical protein